MLDYKAVRDHVSEHVANVANRKVTADPEAVVSLYAKYTEAVQHRDELRRGTVLTLYTWMNTNDNTCASAQSERHCQRPCTIRLCGSEENS